MGRGDRSGRGETRGRCVNMKKHNGTITELHYGFNERTVTVDLDDKQDASIAHGQRVRIVAGEPPARVANQSGFDYLTRNWGHSQITAVNGPEGQVSINVGNVCFSLIVEDIISEVEK